MRVDFLGLEAFLCIADRGSFHQAAAHLNLSQTALSHRMKKLEDDLGVKLLARTTRQVSLTPAGVELLPKAQRIMEEISASFDDLRRRSKEQQEHLAIACLPTLASNFLPRMLREFSKTHPAVRVRIFDHSASEIVELVRAGEAEFGISIVSAVTGEFETQSLLKETFVVACPEGHELAAKALISWNELDGVPLVRIGTLTGNRLLIDDALGSRRESLLWRYEVRHVGTAVKLVQAGLALAVLPQFALNAARMPGVVAVPLKNPSITRSIGTIARKGVPLTPAAEALRAIVARELRGDLREGRLLRVAGK